jgi:hypothetical protein
MQVHVFACDERLAAVLAGRLQAFERIRKRSF